MEKAVRSQVIKWQVILGAVVCAFIAFCALPGVVIAADVETKTVEYVDRVWNETTKQVDEISSTHECTVLTEKMCKKGLKGGATPETARWYVLDSNIKYNPLKDTIDISGNVNLILKDDKKLTHKLSKKSIKLNKGSTLTIYGQQRGTGEIKMDAATYNAGIIVPEGATLNIKGGTIVAEGTSGGAGIGGDRKESTGTINILGGNVTATGGKKAAGIGSGGDPNSGTDDQGIIAIVGGDVRAQGGTHGAGIGGGNETSGCNILIDGGTITAKGGYCGAGIGGGRDGSDGKLEITGGNIKGQNIKGTDLPRHTITLEGVTEEVEVVGVNIDYGINDVYTLDTNKLYFYMADEEYDKLTEITVRYKDGKEETYYREGYSDIFVNKKLVTITGVEAQDGTYNGLPQIGYRGTPTNEQGYEGEYEITYYYLNGDKYEITNKNNSGAEGEGKAPVYAGDYKVRIAVPNSNRYYGGYCELEFKVEKAIPYVSEKPIIRIVDDDTSPENVVIAINLEDGKVMVGDEEIEGEWNLIDFILQSNPPSFLCKFTPTDELNYECKMVSVDAEVDYVVINITGVEAQYGIYNGLPQQGYTGTPVNEQGYGGEYDITYYLSNGEKTTPENSGAEGEGKAPVYAGEYKLKISVPSSNIVYVGNCELEFKVERATPEIVEAPTLSGVYGTAVKDMKISGGVVKAGDKEIEGRWTVTDAKSTDIPDVGTTEAYEVTFTPVDTRNYHSVTRVVVPNIEKAIPYVTEKPIVRTDNGTSLEDVIIEGGKVTAKSKEIDGKWEAIDVILQSNPPSYLLKFTPTDERNCECTMVSVVAEADANSKNDKQDIIEKVKEKLSDAEVKAKLSEPEVRNKIRTKLVEDEEVREKLLSFIEE